MAEFTFFCSRCGKSIQCDAGYCGAEINCPACQQPITVPQPLNPPTTPPAQTMKTSAGKSPHCAKRNTLFVVTIAAALLLVAGLGLFLFSELHRKPSGMVAWWRAEGNAHDSIGHNTGTLQGDVGFARGKFGQAFRFDGPDAAIKIIAKPDINVGAGDGFTIECWINPSDLSQLHPIAEWNTGGGAWGVHFYIDVGGTGNLYANIVDTGGLWHNLQTRGNIVTSNVFQHVALTYDKVTGEAKLYCNGEIVSEETVGKFKPQTTYDLYLGRRPATGGESYVFAGLMDEVGIYRRALSPSEITAIYNAGKARE